jgi:NAD(P)-dependent dehydrogenase (short-subunit alcohol dehydrogenase family)
MDIQGKVAIVTGAASGIGRATAKRFAAEGARGVVLADLDLTKTQAVASEFGGLAVACDVSVESDIQALVKAAKDKYGQVDIFFSNAGILGREGGFNLEDELWEKMWKIHTMAHVWAARAVVPDMLKQGGGYFLTTASAAGLLNIIESAPYGVTKHSAVAFAEWMRITYGRQGLSVSCLCPQAVRTGMVTGDGGSAGLDGILSPEQVADVIVSTMREEAFLILPHPEVATYFKAKANDYGRWIGGMQKMRAKMPPASWL